ncbi:ZIP family metal transporter [Chitinibacter bivalviorum]|uniref:ZIP family metal transporter n=1 Tax=Chitinibacter bivalviorum TaxID=2739434 RepID=A0A7H9BDM3_9NEIS|nr:ZIP family metal transporter [Chitinibacter bivalviorum]QLG86800.1 ZIP family metal transporter [Chitinibacter bivalviorum]
MSTLSWIITMSLLGSLLSVMAAAAMAYFAKPNWIPKLVSFAVGSLLAAVFLEILPHAFGSHGGHDEHAHGAGELGFLQDAHHAASSAVTAVAEQAPHASPEAISLTILLGIFIFFIMEKLVIWRHCHHESCEELEGSAHEHRHDDHHGHGHSHGHSHGNDHGRAGMMIMIGDTFHNFLDGAVIAAAFMADTSVGIATAVAIIAHEIPQEVGDFIVLLHSGYSKAKALLFNLLSSLAALAGGLLAYFSLSIVETAQPYLLALGAASLIYVAIADLIPTLHKRPHIKDTIHQVLLMIAGAMPIALLHHFMPH